MSKIIELTKTAYIRELCAEISIRTMPASLKLARCCCSRRPV